MIDGWFGDRTAIHTRQSVTLVVLLAVAVLAAGVGVPTAIAQSTTTDLSAEAGTASPGETVTVDFTLANNGDSDEGYILNVTSLPEDFEVVDHTTGADGIAKYNPEKSSWVFGNVEAGESVTPTLTLRLPEDASGEYDITAEATATDDTTVTATATVDVESTLVVRTESGTVTTDSTTTVPVVVQETPDGIAGFNMSVQVDSTENARITGASLNGDFAFTDTSVSDDGSSIRLRALDTNREFESGANEVQLGTVTVEGKQTGTTKLDPSVSTFNDDTGSSVNPKTVAGQVTVNPADGGGGDDGSDDGGVDEGSDDGSDDGGVDEGSDDGSDDGGVDEGSDDGSDDGGVDEGSDQGTTGDSSTSSSESQESQSADEPESSDETDLDQSDDADTDSDSGSDEGQASTDASDTDQNADPSEDDGNSVSTDEESSSSGPIEVGGLALGIVVFLAGAIVFVSLLVILGPRFFG